MTRNTQEQELSFESFLDIPTTIEHFQAKFRQCRRASEVIENIDLENCNINEKNTVIENFYSMAFALE